MLLQSSFGLMHFDSYTLDNMAENNVLDVPMCMSDPTFLTANMLSATASNCPTQPNSIDFNTQHQFMVEFPALSHLQGELMNIPHLSNLVGRNTLSNPLLNESCLMGNIGFDERSVNESGPIFSASSLAALLASRFGSRNHLDETEPPSVNPSEILRTSIPDYHDEATNSAFAASLNAGYDTVYGEINNKWAYDKYLACSEFIGKDQEKIGFPPFQLAESIDRNQWISSNSSILNSDNPCGSSKFDKELSLSLATCQPPIVHGTVIPDQCSEISGSIVTHNNLNERFGSKTAYHNKNFHVGSDGQIQAAQFSCGSKYLRVIQEILAQLASYSLEHFDQVNYPATLTRNSISRSCLSERDYSMMDSDVDGGFCSTRGRGRGRDVEGKKQQLVALLQVVDEQHNQCLDEIHTVISAFHAATELDPRIHARFALQTVSVLYKNLREKISNQILTMGVPSRNGESKEEEISFEASFIRKQWALQQLRKKDHQLWRPQRGLPERSVSVLRAWMFQNFLHPYPKDAEKHLLAVKSGLTRSQVSNWFINARVRLWKPMIEEMYSEMNRRKGRRDGEDTINGRRSHVTIDNLMFDM